MVTCVSVCACVQCNNHHILAYLLCLILIMERTHTRKKTRIDLEPLGAALELLKYLNRKTYS